MDWVRKIHKWSSLVVGIQFLLWLGSGIYFNVMDHHKAGGNQYRAHLHNENQLEKSKLVEPQVILAKADAATSIKVTQLLGQPYYLVNHERGLYANFKNRYSLYHAYTGERFNIDKGVAIELAKQSYNGSGEVVSASYIKGKVDDLPKQKNPVWQVIINDEVNTRVYVEAESGLIAGHSDDDSRFAGIFFMLHFMDYGNEGSFNNIQIILFAFVTLWLSLTGLIWTVDLGLRGQYQVKFFAKTRGVKLFDKHQKSMGTVELSSHTNLLDGLIAHDIALPSTCGGGGTCGRCKVMISPIVKTTSADHLHFNDKELQQGYRLACQHFSNDVKHMTLIDVTGAKKHMLELSSSTFISPFIKELRFKLIGEAQLPYKAGAFMRFFIPAAKGVSIPLNLPERLKPHWHHIEHLEYEHLACTRSYSLAESSDSNDELVFIVKIQTAPDHKTLPGVGSSYLCNLAVGHTIEALGPFEEFYVSEHSDKSMVLLGAGSGMAPLKAIIDEQLERCAEQGRKIHFFYGARNEADLLYADMFYLMAEQNSHFHYYPTLSQPNEEWLGATGYAQQVLALNLTNLGNLEELEFYLCGPQEMMNETISLLKSKGVKDSAIAFDAFI